MITENELHEMVPVEDLIEGDYVDLENDPYADPVNRPDENNHMCFESEYAVVMSEPEIDPEDEHISGVRVEFDVTTVYFPDGHKVRRYIRN